MSAGMAGVIAAVLSAEEPRSNDVRTWPEDEAAAYREAGGFAEGRDAMRALQASKLATRVAEELAKAGYGNVADAWDEGATAGWKQSGEGFNAEYPDESTGECSVDLSANPYREPQHG